MPTKKLFRALNELEIYKKKRDLPVSLSDFGEQFDMLTSIPGLFDEEKILRELKFLENTYPQLIPGLVPHLKRVLSDEKYSELLAKYSGKQIFPIQSLEEWEKIESNIGKHCDQILPLLAKTFRVEIPSTTFVDTAEEIDLNESCKRFRFNVQDDYCQCASFSPCNVLVGTSNGAVYTNSFDYENNKETDTFTYDMSNLQRTKWQLHKWPIHDIQYSNIEDLFISCDSTGGIRLWDLKEFKRLAKYRVSNKFDILLFRTKKQQIVKTVCSELIKDFTLTYATKNNTNCFDILYDVRNGAVWKIAVPHVPTQQMFATAHSDGTARLFYYDRSDCLRLFVHKLAVSCVAFYGRLIATASFDERCLRIFNIDMGHQIRLIDGMNSAILGLAFLDECYVVSVSSLGTIDFADVSVSRIIVSKALEFQSTEKCTFLSRLSERTVAVGGNLGSLFFATFNISTHTIEIIKKLPTASDQSIQSPLLAIKWCSALSNFYAVCA